MFYGALRISSSPIRFCCASATSIRDPSPASRRLRLAHSSSACSRHGISVNFTEATPRSAHEESALQSFPRSGELQLSLVDGRRSGIEHRDLDAARGTRLDRADATDLGIVTGLQFAPQLLLLPWSGLAADRFNQRKLLMLTQASMGVLATALGILTISGYVRLWHVYVFAFVFGAAAALDAPVRQTFVGELVGDEHLPNAVALNSTSFFVGQMIGPAVAGLVIAKIGTGLA